MEKNTKEPLLDILEIRKRLPHRFPFLLIDRVVGFEPGPDPSSVVGRKIVATKCVTANERFFEGHFPDNPVMPGVLQVEAMAQAGALACVFYDNEKLDVLIAKINHARFRKPVTPGDILEIKAEVISERKSLVNVKCVATCSGELVSEVDVVARVFIRKVEP